MASTIQKTSFLTRVIVRLDDLIKFYGYWDATLRPDFFLLGRGSLVRNKSNDYYKYERKFYRNAKFRGKNSRPNVNPLYRAGFYYFDASRRFWTSAPQLGAGLVSGSFSNLQLDRRSSWNFKHFDLRTMYFKYGLSTIFCDRRNFWAFRLVITLFSLVKYTLVLLFLISIFVFLVFFLISWLFLPDLIDFLRNFFADDAFFLIYSLLGSTATPPDYVYFFFFWRIFYLPDFFSTLCFYNFWSLIDALGDWYFAVKAMPFVNFYLLDTLFFYWPSFIALWADYELNFSLFARVVNYMYDIGGWNYSASPFFWLNVENSNFLKALLLSGLHGLGWVDLVHAYQLTPLNLTLSYLDIYRNLFWNSGSVAEVGMGWAFGSLHWAWFVLINVLDFFIQYYYTSIVLIVLFFFLCFKLRHIPHVLLLQSDSWNYLLSWLYPNDFDARILSGEAIYQAVGVPGMEARRFSESVFDWNREPTPYYNSKESLTSVTLEEALGGYVGFLNRFPEQTSILDTATYVLRRYKTRFTWKEIVFYIRAFGKKFLIFSKPKDEPYAAFFESGISRGFSFFGGDFFSSPRFYDFNAQSRMNRLINFFKSFTFFTDRAVLEFRQKFYERNPYMDFNLYDKEGNWVSVEVVLDEEEDEEEAVFDFERNVIDNNIDFEQPIDESREEHDRRREDVLFSQAYFDVSPDNYQRILSNFLYNHRARKTFTLFQLRRFRYFWINFLNDYAFSEMEANYDDRMDYPPCDEAFIYPDEEGDQEDLDMEEEEDDYDSEDLIHYRDAYLQLTPDFMDDEKWDETFTDDEDEDEGGLYYSDATLDKWYSEGYDFYADTEENALDDIDEEFLMESDPMGPGWGQEGDLKKGTVDLDGELGLEQGNSVLYNEEIFSTFYDELVDLYWLNSKLPCYKNFFLFPSERFFTWSSNFSEPAKDYVTTYTQHRGRFTLNFLFTVAEHFFGFFSLEFFTAVVLHLTIFLFFIFYFNMLFGLLGLLLKMVYLGVLKYFFLYFHIFFIFFGCFLFLAIISWLVMFNFFQALIRLLGELIFLRLTTFLWMVIFVVLCFWLASSATMVLLTGGSRFSLEDLRSARNSFMFNSSVSSLVGFDRVRNLTIGRYALFGNFHFHKYLKMFGFSGIGRFYHRKFNPYFSFFNFFLFAISSEPLAYYAKFHTNFDSYIINPIPSVWWGLDHMGKKDAIGLNGLFFGAFSSNYFFRRRSVFTNCDPLSNFRAPLTTFSNVSSAYDLSLTSTLSDSAFFRFYDFGAFDFSKTGQLHGPELSAPCLAPGNLTAPTGAAYGNDYSYLGRCLGWYTWNIRFDERLSGQYFNFSFMQSNVIFSPATRRSLGLLAEHSRSRRSSGLTTFLYGMQPTLANNYEVDSCEQKGLGEIADFVSPRFTFSGFGYNSSWGKNYGIKAYPKTREVSESSSRPHSMAIDLQNLRRSGFWGFPAYTTGVENFDVSLTNNLYYNNSYDLFLKDLYGDTPRAWGEGGPFSNSSVSRDREFFYNLFWGSKVFEPQKKVDSYNPFDFIKNR